MFVLYNFKEIECTVVKPTDFIPNPHIFFFKRDLYHKCPIFIKEVPEGEFLLSEVDFLICSQSDYGGYKYSPIFEFKYEWLKLFKFRKVGNNLELYVGGMWHDTTKVDFELGIAILLFKENDIEVRVRVGRNFSNYLDIYSNKVEILIEDVDMIHLFWMNELPKEILIDWIKETQLYQIALSKKI